jgi:hypothetical protein
MDLARDPIGLSEMEFGPCSLAPLCHRNSGPTLSIIFSGFIMLLCMVTKLHHHLNSVPVGNQTSVSFVSLAAVFTLYQLGLDALIKSTPMHVLEFFSALRKH